MKEAGKPPVPRAREDRIGALECARVPEHKHAHTRTHTHTHAIDAQYSPSRALKGGFGVPVDSRGRSSDQKGTYIHKNNL
eukprot:905401-Rhodomonas_salina.2